MMKNLIIGSTFFIGCLVIAYATYAYTENTRDANHDIMGASIEFDSSWFVATVFMVIALVMILDLTWLRGIGWFLFFYVGGDMLYKGLLSRVLAYLRSKHRR